MTTISKDSLRTHIGTFYRSEHGLSILSGFRFRSFQLPVLEKQPISDLESDANDVLSEIQ